MRHAAKRPGAACVGGASGEHVRERCAARLIVVGERIAGARALAHAEGSPTVPLSDSGLLDALMPSSTKEHDNNNYGNYYC